MDKKTCDNHDEKNANVAGSCPCFCISKEKMRSTQKKRFDLELKHTKDLTWISSIGGCNMTRDEMLRKLQAVNFMFVDPKSDWKDIGFTERPIWVNSKGYGYVACDEYCGCFEGNGIEKGKWLTIRQKIIDGSLEYSDILGTVLAELFVSLRLSDYEGINLCDELKGLLNLSEEAPRRVYCMEDPIEGDLIFYNNNEEFRKAYTRDWCDVQWSQMTDQELLMWAERLSLLV